MSKKRIRRSIGSLNSQNHDIFGGKAQILRAPQSGDVWQFRMWISDEKKYLRKSLHTKDFETATIRAETLFLETMADVATGKKLFGLTLKQLTNLYIEYRLSDVGKMITAGRLTAIKSQLKHLLVYKGEKLKIRELDRNSLFDYDTWRKEILPNTQDATLRNEQSTINHRN